MIRFRSATGIVLAFLASPVVLYGETLGMPVGMVFQQSIEGTASREGLPDSTWSESQEIQVGLSSAKVTIRRAQNIDIYDFQEATWTSASCADSVYFIASLFAKAAFTESELRTRCLFLGPTEAEKNSDAAYIVGVEAKFACTVPGEVRGQHKPAEVTQRWEDGLLHVDLEGREHASCAFSDTVMEASTRSAFERFLVYGLELHPAARRAILDSGRLPRSIVIRNGGMGGIRTITVLTLTEVGAWRSSEDSLPPGLLPVSLGFHRLPDLAALPGRAASCALVPDSLRSVAEAFVETAFAAGHPLDAYLAMVEYQLRTGQALYETMPDGLQKQLRKDKRAKKYLEAISWKDPGQAREAVDKIRSIDRSDLAKGHFMDIELGSALIAAGRQGAGLKYLFDFLQQDPCVAGVWIDIGQSLLRSNMEWAAWECFGAARSLLGSDNSLLTGIVRLEEDLRSRYPERF